MIESSLESKRAKVIENKFTRRTEERLLQPILIISAYYVSNNS